MRFLACAFCATLFTLRGVTEKETHLWQSHSLKGRHRRKGGLADAWEVVNLGRILKSRKNN